MTQKVDSAYRFARRIGLAQINQAVMQVSEVVQANSAVSDKSAAARKELAGQAEMMCESMGRFKLKRGEDVKAKAQSYAVQTEAKPEHIAEMPKKGKIIALSDEEFRKY